MSSTENQALKPLPPMLSGSSKTWGIFWLFVLVACIPMLVPYFTFMWRASRYHYVPFAALAILALAYLRWDHRFYPPRGTWGWTLVGIGMAMVFAGALLQFPWFAGFGFFLIGSALLCSLRGPKDSSLVVLCVPLLMLVQMPLRTDSMLVIQLQAITTRLSSVMLDLFRAPHSIAGNVIQLSDRELFVAEACSGIQSVFTLSFIACLLIAIHRRRVWLVGIYLVISMILAIAANVIRVSTIALGEVYFQLNLTAGWPHEMVGYVALAIAVGFLLSFDQLVVTALHSVSQISETNPFITAWNALALRDHEGADIESPGNNDEEFTNMEPSGSVWYAYRGLAAAAVLILCFSVYQVVTSRKPESFVTSSNSVVFHPDPSVLDRSVAHLAITGHEATRGFANPRLGANSDIWHCRLQADQRAEVQAQFVLSQPHTGWHEMCDCYERLDWSLADRKLTRNDVNMDGEPIAGHVTARFKNRSQFGYLFFAGIGSDGTLVTAPASLTAFAHRVWNRIDTTGVWEQDEVIMLQLWVVSPKKLTPETLADLEEDFLVARDLFAGKIENGRAQASSPMASSSPSPLPALANHLQSHP